METPEINPEIFNDMINYEDIFKILKEINNKLNKVDSNVNKLISLYQIQNNIN